jgi:hypothetical protein
LIPNAPVVDLVTDQIRPAMYSGMLRPPNLSKEFYRFEFCKMTAVIRSRKTGHGTAKSKVFFATLQNRIRDTCGIDLPPPARKTIDPEGRVVKDGVRTVLSDRLAAHASVQHQSFRPVNRLVQFLDSLSEIRPPCNVRGVFSASFRYLRIASINSLRANPAMEEGIAGMGSATTD